MDRNKKYFNENYFYTYMGMEFFSGEGLDLIFPLGGGAIFQPRGGLGGGLSNGIFCEQMLIFTKT